MKRTDILPCIGCFLIPVCRHKNYGALVSDCELLKQYCWDDMTRDENDYFVTIIEVEKELRPTGWRYQSYETNRDTM